MGENTEASVFVGQWMTARWLRVFIHLSRTGIGVINVLSVLASLIPFCMTLIFIQGHSGIYLPKTFVVVDHMKDFTVGNVSNMACMDCLSAYCFVNIRHGLTKNIAN